MVKKRIFLVLLFFILSPSVYAQDCQYADWKFPGLQENTIILDNEPWTFTQEISDISIIRRLTKPRPGSLEGSSLLSDDEAIRIAREFLERNRIPLGIPGPTGFESSQAYVIPYNVAYINYDYYAYVEQQICDGLPVIDTYTAVLLTDVGIPYQILFKWYNPITVKAGYSGGLGLEDNPQAFPNQKAIIPLVNNETGKMEFYLYDPQKEMGEKQNFLNTIKEQTKHTQSLVFIIIILVTFLTGVFLWVKIQKK